MATLYKNERLKTIKIETLAGILSVEYNQQNHSVQMTQAKPKFLTYKGNLTKLCEVLEINETDLMTELPICYGNTGSWTLLIPVVNKAVLDKMIPHSKAFPSVLEQIPKSSIHPFTCLNPKESTFYARHFSSPFSGTIEDSVTGTASSVMGAYSLRYIYPNEQEKQLTVFQGEHLGREGMVQVNVTKEKNKPDPQVSITGSTCFCQSMTVRI